MKIRTALISIVVSAALIGGAGYGAYYTMQGRKSPVEVVPVANVSMGYYGMDQQETIYGSVTSQVAQTVLLNDEYAIDEIFVKEGDKVKEGTPLFSYDMTLPELEYEMQQLDLQTNQLTMTRLEKELEKLKRTPASASLVRDLLTMTASAEEDMDVITELDETQPGSLPEGNSQPGILPSGEPPLDEAGILPEDQPVPQTEGTPQGSENSGDNTSGGLEIEEISDVSGLQGFADLNGETEAASSLSQSVLSYEQLVLEIQAIFLGFQDELRAAEVAEPIAEAVSYYRKHFAEEKVTEEEQPDGSVKEIRAYVLKDSVIQELDAAALQSLQEKSGAMDHYQTVYVEMLIREAASLEGTELVSALEQIHTAYNLLATKQQAELAPEAVECLGTLEASARAVSSQNGEGSSDGVGSDNGISPEAQKHLVRFEVGEGAFVMVGQTDVTDTGAYAEDGVLAFSVGVQEGYEVAEVVMNGADPVTKYEATAEENDYIIENIQNDETVVSVTVRQAAAGNPDGETGNGTGTQTESETGNGTGTQTESGTGDGTGAQTESETGDGTGTQTESETGDGTGTETGDGTGIQTEPETGDGTEIQTETESETESESETSEETEPDTRTKYTLTIKYPALDTREYYEGDTVTIQADMNDVTLEFLGWKLEPMPETLTEEDLLNDRITFVMPAFDLTASAQYQNAPDAIESYVHNFLAVAEELLAENAEQSLSEQERDYMAELENAVVFYQQWLAQLPAEILENTSVKAPELEKYKLKSNVSSYLTEQGKKVLVKQLKNDYKELCLRYARTLFDHLDASDLDRELLDKAAEIYDILGEKWRKELEKQWEEEHTPETPETDENGEPIPQPEILSIGDTLEAYDVMCQFQDYLKLPPETTDDQRYLALQNIWNAYMNLTDEQKALVSSDPLFAETLAAFGLWDDFEPETEPFDTPGDWGDYWGDDSDEPLYTASELQQMIWDKEQEIKSCALDIRQSELDLKRKQDILDEKVVKSTMEGTVISIGDIDGNSDEDYFVKVANEAGLYARGALNELTLERLHVGDTITGMLTTNGASFSAVIKEISEYPDANGNAMSFGSENSNASYYPFYALIEDTTDMEEGEAEIYLSASRPDMENAIYLENYFVRSEPDGRTYVYKQGEDGNLTKQYVTTGRKMYGYAVEIAEGLDHSDKIAFPYGKDVVEGAKTKEVDMLQ